MQVVFEVIIKLISIKYSCQQIKMLNVSSKTEIAGSMYACLNSKNKELITKQYRINKHI